MDVGAVESAAVHEGTGLGFDTGVNLDVLAVPGRDVERAFVGLDFQEPVGGKREGPVDVLIIGCGNGGRAGQGENSGGFHSVSCVKEYGGFEKRFHMMENPRGRPHAHAWRFGADESSRLVYLELAPS
jgi:hypothetical protein